MRRVTQRLLWKYNRKHSRLVTRAGMRKIRKFWNQTPTRTREINAREMRNNLRSSNDVGDRKRIIASGKYQSISFGGSVVNKD